MVPVTAPKDHNFMWRIPTWTPWKRTSSTTSAWEPRPTTCRRCLGTSRFVRTAQIPNESCLLSGLYPRLETHLIFVFSLVLSCSLCVLAEAAIAWGLLPSSCTRSWACLGTQTRSLISVKEQTAIPCTKLGPCFLSVYVTQHSLSTIKTKVHRSSASHLCFHCLHIMQQTMTLCFTIKRKKEL